MALKKKQRIVFSFDSRSLDALKELAEEDEGSMAQAVRKSLEIRRALKRQGRDGFREIVVRNPQTKQERVIVLPESER
jgi:hypothetical protein